MITGEDNKSKGFGFVSYEDSTHAEAACNDLDGKEIEGKPIYVGRAQKKAERTAELKKKFDALKMERMTRYQGNHKFCISILAGNLNSGRSYLVTADSEIK